MREASTFRAKAKEPRWYATYAAITVACLLSVYGTVFTEDAALDGIIWTLLVGPVVGTIILILLREHLTPRTTLFAGFLYIAIIWFLSFYCGDTLRNEGRWLVYGSRYRQQVDALPPPEDGTLKHVEWDGWGFAGMDTTVYLVFDPTRSLSSKSKARPKGLPCEVAQVHHLSGPWYSVTFYTETAWDSCTD